MSIDDEGDRRGEMRKSGESNGIRSLIANDERGATPSTNPGLHPGGKRNGFHGDNGDGVSGSQYERAGTGGTSRSAAAAVENDIVPGRG